MSACNDLCDLVDQNCGWNYTQVVRDSSYIKRKFAKKVGAKLLGLYGFCFEALKKNRLDGILTEHACKSDADIKRTVLKQVFGTSLGKMLEAMRMLRLNYSEKNGISLLQAKAVRKFKDSSYRLLESGFMRLLEWNQSELVRFRKGLKMVVAAIRENDAAFIARAYWGLKKTKAEAEARNQTALENACKRLLDKNYDLTYQAFENFKIFVGACKGIDQQKERVCKLFLNQNLRLEHGAFAQ